ncbi:F5/8 type C domain-containing protein [Haloactinopolyspora alba]|uniref:F5/8 type C domain-containing protein n=2 Tax=Haloactinopolyspora alba TaxID=648780 RepID=A0A2P8EC14_9ACTN|nr:F5/8 type C domain-containing protein [Haloactinopolyspora alba]
MLPAAVLVMAGLPSSPGQAAHVPASTPAGDDLAADRPMSASSHTDVYVAANANDGDPGSYWESANHEFPEWLQVDLGVSVPVDSLVLRLPTGGWEARTQAIEVLGSSDGSSFSTLVAEDRYTFRPEGSNTVTVTFDAVTARYLRLRFTANTAWPAGQLSELEVYGPSGGDTEAPSAPANLAYSRPSADEIELTWDAASDDVGVTGYDVYANGELLTSVDGSALSYTDTRPAHETVTYHVRARDAVGNQSPDSNAVTREGAGDGPGRNLAAGRPISASSTVHTYVAANANDDDTGTYWEGAPGAYPSTLTVELGANAEANAVVVQLNPDPVWGPRTQTLEVLGRAQGSSSFQSIVPEREYAFDPASGNTVTIPVSATAADFRLEFTANTGAPNGQVAEFQVIGESAPNPDLVVADLAWSPGAPSASDDVTLSATVRNTGELAAPATSVDFSLDAATVGSTEVGPLDAGASASVSADVGALDAASYELSAEVDPAGSVVERDDTNNTETHPDALVVAPAATSDLVPVLSWTPQNPAAGETVDFTVALENRGTVASASGAHGVTLTVTDGSENVVRTLSGSHDGVLEPGAGSAPVDVGSWTAADGQFTVAVEADADANELPVAQDNNTANRSLFIGRGADMPYVMLEAEDAVVGGGAQVLAPNRTIGDLAGEASGRQAVTLDRTGEYVEFTTTQSTNTLVTRFSIPDAAGGGGIEATLNVYVDGEYLRSMPLTSRFAWLYGNEASPGNSPGLGEPRHIYDEANILLDTTVPAGSTIRLQKDAENTSTYAIDFVSLEQVAPEPNPDPQRYIEPDGFTHADVQDVLDEFRMDTSGELLGVYLPPGDYRTGRKFQVYGKPIEVIGAGPWYTRFNAPATQNNTDVGFRADSSVNGSTFSGFAYFGNYTSRIDGPGKVFDFHDVSDITIDDIWVEHMVCMYWGTNTDNMTIKNSRARNLFADVLNMTNGSTNNLVTNIESRASGDDSFALFAATDSGGGDQTGNVYENLTSILTWRAAGLAVYGGYGNTFRDIHIADTLVYSGITISSLDFGIPMDGFGADPPTRFENISVVRAGGHFWGAQTFPGIWIFSASEEFQGIRVNNVDIVDPTYSGIMFQTGYEGGQPLNPVTDTVFTDVTIRGARKSGDEFDAKSGFGIWVNEMPEQGQGPAVGSAVFDNLTLIDNHQDIKNTTSTFELVINE